LVDIELETTYLNSKNVGQYVYGVGSLKSLESILASRRNSSSGVVIFLVDGYFEHNDHLLKKLPVNDHDRLIFVSVSSEPTTTYVNALLKKIVSTTKGQKNLAVVGIGGGSTLDVAKAISNLLTNGGCAEDYQGWDLVRVPGVYKIGVPTLSGTGAEASRTCVMINKENGKKLGMNSEYTVFDQLILDPDLTATVPENQYFYSGMDTWIHCVEALKGSYRHPIGDAFSNQAIGLCREVFDSNEMMSDSNRGKLMVASYLGGSAIANSYVGVVHPFSAGLSVVLNLPHCLANCVTMMAMEPYYPKEYGEFRTFIDRNEIVLPRDVCQGLSDAQFDALYRATIVHEKPLTNALGTGFSSEMTKTRVRELFERM